MFKFLKKLFGIEEPVAPVPYESVQFRVIELPPMVEEAKPEVVVAVEEPKVEVKEEKPAKRAKSAAPKKPRAKKTKTV